MSAKRDGNVGVGGGDDDGDGVVPEIVMGIRICIFAALYKEKGYF